MSLYIVRGLTGAGKTTYARKMAQEKNCLLLEPDLFLYENGDYRYSKDRYEEAWDICLGILDDVLDCYARNFDVIFVDVLPTLEKIKEVEYAYGDKAKQIITLEIDLETAMRRNLHGVSEADLREMARCFQTIKRKSAITLDAMDELTYEKINDLPEGW
ncbi:MAG: AAA family ATPase [Victivallales bacterium]|nr:AAA family ATPase [Victivallales bacterium]